MKNQHGLFKILYMKHARKAKEAAKTPLDALPLGLYYKI
jgi:hypothetical protein